MFIRWILYVIKYYIWCAFNPYVFMSPGSSTVSNWKFEKSQLGFIIWRPGTQYKKTSTRFHISWHKNKAMNFENFKLWNK